MSYIRNLLISLTLIVSLFLASQAYAFDENKECGQYPEYKLTAIFHNIPKSTIMIWDNGKYRPLEVNGYEGVADYPDQFWIYGNDIDLMIENAKIACK